MTSVRKDSLKQHEMRHSVEFGFHCKLCTKKFKTNEYYRQHVARHAVKGKPFKCTRCDARYRERASLIKHLKYIHDPNRNSRYECIFCKRKFMGIIANFNHLRSHIQERVNLCRLCPKEFASNVMLRMHSLTHTREGATRFPCDLCPTTFSTPWAVKVHIVRIHTGERSCKCEVCNKHFPTPAGLRSHMLVHSTIRSFECHECSKSFKSASQLKGHGRVHSTQRNHACPICVKRFKSKLELEIHIRTHTGEKAFKCEICGKCFATKGNLVGHGRVHTKEKQYHPCAVCQKKFSSGSYMRVHYKRMHTSQSVRD